ncbi:MAG: sugar transferase, partial [Candidatus Dormiibacterota bacterium]
LLLLIALAIRLDGPGPIFFRQERVGRFGRRFRMWKFRTMTCGADSAIHRQAAAAWFRGQPAYASAYKDPDDRRVTRAGRLLRRTDLDELPQLLNVLAGDMSLVGPRPAIPYELDLYEPAYFVREQVRPGMTGLWQVMGRERLSAARMMELDASYVEQARLRLEVSILARTFVLMARRLARCTRRGVTTT